MFNIWTDGLGEKVRTPQRFGIGVAYVGPDTYFPSDEERKRAIQISISKGVVPAGTPWQACSAIDEVTGECASIGGGPLPPWVLRDTPPPPGIIPREIPIRGVLPKVSAPMPIEPPGPARPALPPVGTTCPPGQRLVGMTQSFPGQPICEPIRGGEVGGGVRSDRTPRPNQHQRLRDSGGRSSAVELCPLSGYVTRPVPGASEYQVYRCTPGERVPINLRFDPQRRGLQEAGIREALQRADVSGQSTGIISAESATSPNWLLIGGIAIGAFLLLGKGR